MTACIWGNRLRNKNKIGFLGDNFKFTGYDESPCVKYDFE